jgi:branched-chain amino acid transport system substrate-binding protein
MPVRRGRRKGFGRQNLMVAVAAVGILTSGCATFGGTNGEPVAACRTPGLTPGHLNLGVIFPNTGDSSSAVGAYRSGVDARLGVANATGGVNGRQVTYSWADDQALAAGNLGAAQELVLHQNIFSVQELSTASDGGAAFLNRQGVPVVGTGLDPVWSRYRNMFTYTYLVANGPAVSTWGAYVKAQHGTRTAVLYSSLSDFSNTLAGQWSASLNAAGVKVDLIEATPKVTAPATVAAQIIANGDDVLTGFTDTVLFTQIAMATDRLVPGRLKVIFSMAGYDKGFLDAFGKSLPGLSTMITYAPFEQHMTAAQKFLTAMTRYSPQIQPSNNEIALAGWIDTDMTLKGLTAAGACPTRAGFMTALRNTTSYDAGGLLVRPVNLKTNFGQLNLCYTFLKIAPDGTSWNVVPPAPFCGHTIK